MNCHRIVKNCHIWFVMAQSGALWRKKGRSRPMERNSFGTCKIREIDEETEWRAQQELNLQPLVP